LFFDEIRRSGARCEELGWRNGYDAMGRVRLLALLNRFRPDVVHDHGVPPFIRPLIRLAITRHVVTSEHGDTAVRLRSARRWPAQALQWLDMRAAEVLIANSMATASLVRRHYLLPEKQIEVISPGVDLDAFSPLQRPSARSPVFQLGYVGRINANVKGVDHLPQIVQLLREELGADQFRMSVVGDGPDLPYLKARVEELGLAEHFAFRGTLTDGLPACLASLDVVVVPSRVEAWGLTVAEALASGVRVIAFDVGGLREVAGDCPDVALVSPGDVLGMVQAIIRFHSQDRTAQRIDGPAYARARFDRSRTTRRIESIFERLVA
jgi:glycosyltransferase involved in cell wall biosynthesis